MELERREYREVLKKMAKRAHAVMMYKVSPTNKGITECRFYFEIIAPIRYEASLKKLGFRKDKKHNILCLPMTEKEEEEFKSIKDKYRESLRNEDGTVYEFINKPFKR